jgi:hypothetical protein
MKSPYRLEALSPADECSRLFFRTSSPTSFFNWAFSLRSSLSSSDSVIASASSLLILIPDVGVHPAADVRTVERGAPMAAERFD